MKKYDTPVTGCFILEFPRYMDARGFFQESYHIDAFGKIGLPPFTAQDNFSFSQQNVLRGLHFQNSYPQGKLVSCWLGRVFDVCVDLRPESPTFKKWWGMYLSWDSPKALYVPKGCAHGFQVTTGPALVHYKCTTLYNAATDSGIRFDDPEIDIRWPPLTGKGVRIMSNKDLNLPSLHQYLNIKG